jgi:aminoglycoside 3-N-acetyltransferase
MLELDIVQRTKNPNTKDSLIHDLIQLGLREKDVIITHSSLSSLGWTIGGPEAVIDALISILTPNGTIVMPTHTGGNSEPSYWQHPPVPNSWWPLIRSNTPGFDTQITPTRGMGVIVDTFRRFPNVIRSSHPQASFAAWGKQASYIIENHPLTPALGDGSPLAKLYDLDAKVLLLGVGHDNNTSLHLGEWRSYYPNKKIEQQGAAILVNGDQKWVTWNDLAYNNDDFENVGRDFEKSINYQPKRVGLAETRLYSMRKMVDFSIKWFAINRCK